MQRGEFKQILRYAYYFNKLHATAAHNKSNVTLNEPDDVKN